VRTSEIRNIDHAAACAWPGTEQHWVDGRLLPAANSYTHRANSAAPLSISASDRSIPPIVDWHAARGRTAGEQVPEVTISTPPDDDCLRLYRRDIPVAVPMAVLDADWPPPHRGAQT
jgi:N-acetylglutamate synthase